jgi:2,3-dihydroxybenzoate-AMP ligase
VDDLMEGFTPWPADDEARYQAEGYWGRRLLGDVPNGRPGDIALVAGDERLTYAELDRRADRTATGLQRLGLRKGDRAVVQLPNGVGLVVAFLALTRLGAVPVLALPAHRESEIRYLCELTGARAYIAADVEGTFDYRTLARSLPVAEVVIDGDPQEFTALDDLRVAAGGFSPPDPPDPAEMGVLLLSGGTTGRAKLIPRTHRDYVYNLEASADVCGFTSDTVYLAVLPVAHNYSLACPGVLGTLARGGTAVLSPSASPGTVFPLIERERVTVSAVVPTIMLLWLEAAAGARMDLSSLTLLQVGGARFPAERIARVRAELGCEVQQVFGMAEGLLSYTRRDDPAHLVEHTQGRPLSPADELRVVDADGRDVAPGQVGELLTRGPYTLRGYYRAAEHNAHAFTRDGFYRTGDLVRVLPSGHLVVEGRRKDQINRGAEKVAAPEVEIHLLAHPAVHDAAVIGLPDPVMGERTCALLILHHPHADKAPSLRDIKVFLRERGLAPYKYPDQIEYVDAFPRTTIGKINKQELAARFS